MAALSARNVIVIFMTVLMTLMVVPNGRCIDLLKSVTNEGNLTGVVDNVKNITWNVREMGTGIGYDIRNSTELVKVNDTEVWPAKNETLTDKLAAAGKKVKGFFDNLTSGIFGGSRKKRSTALSDNLNIVRNAKLWKSFIEEMQEFKKSGSMGFERSHKDNIRWPASHMWYNWPRMGHEEVARGKNSLVPDNEKRHLQPIYEAFHPPKAPARYDGFSQPPMSQTRTRNRYLPQAHHTYNPMMHSVKIFKQMKNNLIVKKRKKELGEVGEREHLGQHEFPEMMEIYTGNEEPLRPQMQYKCKAGTKGIMSYQEGRKIRSKGLTYSEEDSRGRRTLLCKAETSEISQPDENIFLKNSVIGLNVITNDNDPFKFLEKGNDINSDTLEIGSQSGSELSYLSEKNKSMSSVSTQGRGAHSQTKVNTKFIYENGLRTAFDSSADVEGSTTFNATEETIPLMLTSRKEESSSILQNPDNLEIETGENEGVATYMNYEKKVDFDIAFRNFFEYQYLN